MTTRAIFVRGPVDGLDATFPGDPPDAVYVDSRKAEIVIDPNAGATAQRYLWNAVHYCQMPGCARHGAHTYVWAPTTP